MKSITKRLMECTILTALILVLGNKLFEAQHIKNQIANAPEYAKIFNQAIWDKYGPGSQEAYYKLLPSSDDTISGANQEIFMSNQFNNPCENQGFVANASSPEWFDDYLNQMQTHVQNMEKALQCHPFIAAPNESHFSDIDSRESHNLYWLKRISYAIRQMAYRDWLEGDFESALKQLKTIIDFGESVRYAFAKEHLQFLRINIHHLGFDGFDHLIWTNPDYERTSLIYKSLNNIKFNEWKLPRFCQSSNIENLLISSIFEEKSFYSTKKTLISAIFKESKLSSDQLAASILISNNFVIPHIEFAKKESKTYDYNDLCSDFIKVGFLTNKEKKTPVVNSMLGKWTTLAALRKRCDRLPDAFYESDPLLSAEQARQLPKLTYAVSRLYSHPSITNSSNIHNTSYYLTQRMTVIKRRVLALQAAYKWRMERDKNGQWLTPEQMHKTFPLGQELCYVVDMNPDLLTRHFIKNNIISEYAPSSKLIPAPSFFNARDSKIIYVQCLPQKNDNSPQAMKFRKENHKWMEGMLSAMSPLVQSVTSRITHASQQGDYRREQYMDPSIWMRPLPIPKQGDSPVEQREYIVKIKIPRKTYWIFSNTAYKIHTDQVYDSSYSTRQFEETNEIQLAGWEW